jgi:GMP synthase-like glutamine amidotransferase
MKSVRIFIHDVCEPPDYLVSLLDRLGYPYELVCLYRNRTVPMDLDKVSALVFMGGAGNVHEPTEWMQQELELIHQADAENIPVLGICLGAQLICKALGGIVWEADHLEVGWHQVRLLADSHEHPSFQSLPDEFTVFQWHAHVFLPPAGATALATSDCTSCQAFSLRQHLALQFHLEMDERVIRTLLKTYASDIAEVSECVQDAATILQDVSANSRATFDIADRLFTPWFDALYQ